MGKPATRQNGEIVRNGSKEKTLAGLLTNMSSEIARAIPKHLDGDRMARVCMTALRTTKNLDRCTQYSFLGSILSAAQLGLEPNTALGFCYLIPRENKREGVYECSLMLGYQGMLELVRRTGLVNSVYAFAVREGDEFHEVLGLRPDLIHRPGPERGEITHVYAVAHLKDGEPIFRVLTTTEVEARRKRSAASSRGPWVTDWEAMALKTAVRALFTWLPKSPESIAVSAAVALDEAADTGRRAQFDETVTRVLDEAEIPPDAFDADGVEVSPEQAAKMIAEGSAA